MTAVTDLDLAAVPLSRRQLIETGRRYWQRAEECILQLALNSPVLDADGPFRGYTAVALPDWAADLGVGSPPYLLVDSRALRTGSEPPFDRCDWWLAADLMLNGSAEREHEARHGPIHSFSWRLDIDPHAFDHAWVNRFLLIIRRLAARRVGSGEAALFGPLPSAELIVTHDVDAVTKRPELRLKQGAFQLANAVRHLWGGRFREASGRFAAAARFSLGPGDFWTFDQLIESLSRRGLRSRLHFYAGPQGLRRGWPGCLMDPGYDCADPRITDLLRSLAQNGFEVGLHPSYDSWASPDMIAQQREHLTQALRQPVTVCRQHWLRFSWEKTWISQAKAGIILDSTLGFNDRPGFRNSAALRFQPSVSLSSGLPLTAEPMILMDSHLYDYDLDAHRDLGGSIERWIREVKAVRGVATVLWHPHTLDRSYGWGKGFEVLLDIIAAR